MSKTIYVPRGTREQLECSGINPWHQEIPYQENESEKFPKELRLEDSELVALKNGTFHPREVEEELPEIARRIKID